MRLDPKTAREAFAFITIVLLGVVGRIACASIPNCAPVAALALFAGFYFRSRVVAALAPLLIMGVSDAFIGGSEWYIQLTVYVMLTVPVFARRYLRRSTMLDGNRIAPLTNAAVSLAPAFLSAVAFFLVTNFACWLFWYPTTWEGLTRCYLLALPFLRNTLLSDMCFTATLFAGYTVLHAVATTRSRWFAIGRA